MASNSVPFSAGLLLPLGYLTGTGRADVAVAEPHAMHLCLETNQRHSVETRRSQLTLQ